MNMTKITAARMTWRHEVGYRLRIARKRAKITLEEVGRHLGFKKQNVAGWESAASEMKIWDLMRVARLYAISTDELLTGKPAETPASAEVLTVPKIPREWLSTVAANFSEEIVRPADLFATAHSRVPVTVSNLSNYAFALDVFDESLEPVIRHDDVVIVDRANEPRNGEACLYYLGATKQSCLLWYQAVRESKREFLFELEGQNAALVPSIQVTADHRAIYLGAVRQLIRTATVRQMRTPPQARPRLRSATRSRVAS